MNRELRVELALPLLRGWESSWMRTMGERRTERPLNSYESTERV